MSMRGPGFKNGSEDKWGSVSHKHNIMFFPPNENLFLVCDPLPQSPGSSPYLHAEGCK
jgi:hypothetical protein